VGVVFCVRQLERHLSCYQRSLGGLPGGSCGGTGR
jgi:hypothetical protein